ncbi:MAG: methyltransferase domain-containing protein [Candidatus Oleimicrobiaceae bacterium]
MGNDAWQLQMFRRSLKKRAKMQTLLRMLPDLHGKRCMDITCGDNTGSLNYYFRAHGGWWVSADLEGRNLPVMMSLLHGRVLHLDERHFSFPDNCFDVVVSIDCLEHLEDEEPFLAELYRVTKPGGTAIVTVPNGDRRLAANKLKNLIGMTPEKYGHVRPGYTHQQLAEKVKAAGFRVSGRAGYSRFFMESLELAINALYVLVMNKDKAQAPDGVIAPTSQEELKSHGLSYKLYGLLYPLLWLISRLDYLLFWGGHYAVAVRAIKPA